MINSSAEGFIPKLEGHGRLGKQGQTDLNYVPVLALSGTILLVSMRA
jgi:hypothetical protein